MAGGVGALAACCTVHLLIVAGVLAGLGGAAIGGIATATGITVAAIVWLTALLTRRRETRSSAGCHTPGTIRDDQAATAMNTPNHGRARVAAFRWALAAAAVFALLIIGAAVLNRL
ncbi:hypothetical protein ACIA59_24180 [Micromonospora haikouensis]|uniref:hypothetical protein n=1 Tax=Micromonospora haikouensis TaxID=686309 RepID=UPI0037A7F6C8